MAPLAGAAVKELADILCDEFQPEAELERLVQVTLNRGLFTDFAGPRQPLRTVAFQLVTALEQEGLTAPLLHGALRASNHNPRLVEFCRRFAPELLREQPPAAQQVADVVGELNAVRARLADPGVRAAVITSREQLEQLGDRILRLDLYKRLHDGLHMIQVSFFRQVLDAIKRFKTDATADDTLDEYTNGLQTLSAQAAATATAFPADGSGVREQELRWVGDLDREVIGKLREALRTADVRPAREAAGRLKTLLNFESARVNHALTEAARQLPLQRLIDTLRRVDGAAAGAGPDGPALRGGLAGLARAGHAAQGGGVASTRPAGGGAAAPRGGICRIPRHGGGSPRPVVPRHVGRRLHAAGALRGCPSRSRRGVGGSREERRPLP